MKHALITGGFGFIGSNFARLLLRYGVKATIIDNCGYASDESRVSTNHLNLTIKRNSICDQEAFENLPEDIDSVFHFAAETHVDRSIKDPDTFLQTNILGTNKVLEFSKKRALRCVLISTDEVYGSAIEDQRFSELDILNPSSPYSASKASSDLLGISYHKTFGTDVIITRCSNNYGEYQNIEKLIPFSIYNIMNDSPILIYGDGSHQRDWINVDDHCRGILYAFNQGKSGEIYNIGTGIEISNLELLKIIANEIGKELKIEFIEDRLGHDTKYSIDSTKIQSLGWKPHYTLEKGIQDVVYWYKYNMEWLEGNKVKNQKWLEEHYGK